MGLRTLGTWTADIRELDPEPQARAADGEVRHRERLKDPAPVSPDPLHGRTDKYRQAVPLFRPDEIRGA